MVFFWIPGESTPVKKFLVAEKKALRLPGVPVKGQGSSESSQTIPRGAVAVLWQ